MVIVIDTPITRILAEMYWRHGVSCWYMKENGLWKFVWKHCDGNVETLE